MLTRRFITPRNLMFASLIMGLLAIGAAASVGKNTPSGDSKGLAATPVSPEEARRATASAQSLSTAFRVAAERVLPAVVTIETRPAAVAADAGASPRSQDPFGGHNPFEGTPFGDMFRDMPFEQGPGLRSPQPRPHGQGLGSGVIIDPSGLVLTNNHVVASGGDVTVRLSDGREFKAVDVWTDPKTDIAVVKIDGASDLVAAQLGNSDVVAIGDWVLALGQPFGLESTVTAGIISAKHRGIGITDRENFLQTDAAINPGNSGGPLVNLTGEVIGINTAISSRSGGNDGVGFAVPINLAKWVGQQLADGGTVQRAYLGVGIQPVTQQLANQFQVKPREGVVVTEVHEGTPAAKAGLKSGDVIVEFDGQRISSPQELQVAVERSQIGDRQELSIVREGKRLTLNFKPEVQPETFGASAHPLESNVQPQRSRLEKLGLEISALEPAVAKQLGLEGAQGVVVTNVRQGSSADRAGLESGMLITEVNRQKVSSVDEATKAIDETLPGGALLLVRSKAGSRFIVVRP